MHNEMGVYMLKNTCAIHKQNHRTMGFGEREKNLEIT